METLTVTSPAFEEGGWIPRVHTGRGEDRSPGLSPAAVSLAVTLDDDSHPIFPHYNHWAAWNLPAAAEIPAAIPAGRRVETLGRAMQGIAYGRHRYKGPKPPLRWLHSYTFTVYVLDCFLDLSPASRKAALLTAMEGHVLQRATLSGKYQNGRG